MVSGTGTKCPVCGKAVAVGLVSQTILQHENKLGERCSGTGQAPVVAAPRAARPAGSATARSSASKSNASKPSPATKGGMTVRKIDVDPEVLRERQERAERLRRERAEAARQRNDIGVSYFDEPGA